MAVAIARGDLAQAERILQSLIERGLPVGASAARYRANLLAQQGQPAQARAVLGPLLAGDPGAGREDAQWLNGLCQLAGAATALGDPQAAATLYPLLKPYEKRFAVDGMGSIWLGSVAHYLGSLAHTLGHVGRAATHFEVALTAHRRAGAPLLVARTLRRYALAVGGEQAETLQREALTIEAELGISPVRARAQPETFARHGEYWTLVYADAVSRVRDSKGMRDIAYLLARPGQEVHSLDLYAGGAVPHTRPTGDVLDAAAKRAYRARLTELEEEIDDAEATQNVERAERARGERDALVAELTAAYGLGGRSRRMGDPAERARSAVSWRLRDALGRIDAAHPALARHLRNSLRTGTYCSYQPERPIAWRL